MRMSYQNSLDGSRELKTCGEKKRSDNTREWVLDGEGYERKKEREEDDSGDYGSANASLRELPSSMI